MHWERRANAKLLSVLCFVSAGLTLSPGLNPQAPPPSPALDRSDALVKRALATELQSAQDTRHPMRYRLRKSSPRLTSTKEIYETRDGAVAHLISVNDQPLTNADQQQEQARIDLLLSDPSRQRHRKQVEEDDAVRALKILRALPRAFFYQFVDTREGPAGMIARFSFKPNPHFHPPDFETQALVVMTGEIWIDVAQERVTRLEVHLQQDVDFGWGILGQLNKAGWIIIEQAPISEGQWRIVHFQMKMNGRAFFKSKTFDTTEEQTQFAPLPVGLGYQDAIRMMRTDQIAVPRDSH